MEKGAKEPKRKETARGENEKVEQGDERGNR